MEIVFNLHHPHFMEISLPSDDSSFKHLSVLKFTENPKCRFLCASNQIISSEVKSELFCQEALV